MDSLFAVLGSHRFGERGVVNIKGKGDMTTYLLLGRKEEVRRVGRPLPSP